MWVANAGTFQLLPPGTAPEAVRGAGRARMRPARSPRELAQLLRRPPVFRGGSWPRTYTSRGDEKDRAPWRYRIDRAPGARDHRRTSRARAVRCRIGLAADRRTCADDPGER